MKRLILLSILMLGFYFLSKSQNVYRACGLQSGIWNYDTVYITCDVSIPNGETLHIESGTRVVFNGHYSVQVQGTIKAIGTAADSIIFRVSDTSGFGNIHSTQGGWKGIKFIETAPENDSSSFEYCVFTSGKAVGDSINSYGGVIFVSSSSKLSIRHSTFKNNYAFYWGGAVYAFKSNILMEHCRITQNVAGNDGMVYGYGGGLCFVASLPNLRFMRLDNNSSTGIGGGASFESSNPLLLNCIIENNYSGLGGGLGFLRATPDRMISNLLLRYNEARFFGGGIANINATPVISNSTIIENTAAMGGGFYCNESSHTKLYNSILWNNTSYDTLGSQVWIWDVFSEPGFYNCAIQGGIPLFGGSSFHGEYIANTELNPLFVDAQQGDFRLLAGSPCINSGTNTPENITLPINDLDLHSRIMYATIDMGAYEYQGYVGVGWMQNEEFRASVYPNPLTCESVIEVESNVDTDILFTLRSNDGKQLVQHRSFLMKLEKNKLPLTAINIEIEKLKRGVYVLEISNKKQRLLLKLIQ